ncbi:MAG: PhoH family protein [Betaproteobacteria bacterium]|nr:PhoH family protein [Betaproteobacteria bacterium]
MKPVELVFTPVDNQRLANLCGALDENLRQIETALDVSIARRGERFALTGSPGQTQVATQVLQSFYAQAKAGLTLEDVQLGLIEAAGPRKAKAAEGSPTLITRRQDLHGRTPRQVQYLQNILTPDLTFSIGPAGTGKTYLAVACAVDAIERDSVKRIVLVRPAVEAGERLGFLPGDMAAKVDPYLRPLYDSLYDLMGFDKVAKMFDRGAIEIAPLAFMRGRTLNHAFVILDEAQNTTPEQMKMFLTRIGFGSKAVVNGDVTQIDLGRGQKSGLIEAQEVLRKVRGIAFTHFDSEDVVRHPLVQRIVNAYGSYRSRATSREPRVKNDRRA